MRLTGFTVSFSMVTLSLVTVIHAPIERCFDLARSIDLHVVTTARTEERAVAGVTSGLIGRDEKVTWSARHFGVRQRLTSRITGFERPNYFQDTMIRGAFRFFQHDHYFQQRAGGSTELRDVVRFAAPIPILGTIAEIPLRPYMCRFLEERNDVIKRTAESDDWRRFLNSNP